MPRTATELPSVPTTRLVVDTGPLLILAFSLFRRGKYLIDAAADIPRTNISQVSGMLASLFTGKLVFTTPQVLVELRHLARARAKLDDDDLKDFLKTSADLLAKLEEVYVPKDDLVDLKASRDAWAFCFADTSVILASLRLDAPLLTNDNRLKRFTRAMGVDVRHIYYDLFLSPYL
ncbi:MAG: hypothetical protein HYX92_16760 [Chloroflexi bacterium]|nr:hypothetical protein [Chloroflexota bacterium]